MHTLLIDNHDSFTYNLFQYLAASNGEPPTVVCNDEMDWEQAAQLDFDNIVISPGPGRPQRRTDLGLSADALAHAQVPILGVCLGHQAIGHACGASVDLATRPMHGRVDSIRHDGRDLFMGIPNDFEAVRYHSLAVTQLPDSLEPLAWSPDGTLMAMRHRDKPWWGVQFHPESICTEYGARLLGNFRDLTWRWRQMRRGRQTSSGPGQTAHASSAARPVWTVNTRLLDVFVDPERIYQTLFAAQRPAFWLDSSLTGPGIARFSFIGDASGPASEYLCYDSASRSLQIQRGGVTHSVQQSIFDYLGQRMGAEAVQPDASLPFDFTGGFVGYFGYELKRELQGDAAHVSPAPDAAGLFVDRFIAFDHAEQQIWIVWLTPHADTPSDCAWADAVGQMILSQEHVAAPDLPAQRHQAADALQSLRWRIPLRDYRLLIDRCQHEIRMGESYEICLTNQLVGSAEIDALQVYRALREKSGAPYAAYLAFPDLCVLSASPELFLAVHRDGSVESKPIKGTARRGRTPDDDARIKTELMGDEKTRSENLMIVDLLRNDLNRCCEVGSVHVPSLFAIESFATVHQMVSTVRGKLRPDLTAVDALKAAFPGGSMTGAPKVRTMRIIDQLEDGARGIYSGSLGYLSLNGAARLNIVIRTLVLQGGRVSLGAGGAIVALSDTDDEVAEIVLKARALWDTLKACGALLDDADLLGTRSPSPGDAT
jgi:para-aminobenzoate synthetase